MQRAAAPASNSFCARTIRLSFAPTLAFAFSSSRRAAARTWRAFFLRATLSLAYGSVIVGSHDGDGDGVGGAPPTNDPNTSEDETVTVATLLAAITDTLPAP